MPDLDGRERTILVPAVALMLIMGVLSPFFLKKMDASTDSLLNKAGGVEVEAMMEKSKHQPASAPRNALFSVLSGRVSNRH